MKSVPLKLCRRGFRFGFRRLIPGCLLDQLRYCVSRLSALADPVLNPIGLEIDLGRLASWVVSSQIFQISAIALRLFFFYHDAIRRALLGAGAHQFNC